MQLLSKKLSFPIEVEWSITWSCNVHCYFCSTGKYDTQAIEKEWEEVFKNIKKAKPIFITLSGGEPLIHPDIDKIITNILKNNIFVNLTTNGMLLNDNILNEKNIKKINWILISLHAVTQDIAQKIMGSSYCVNTVIQNIKNIRKVNKNVSLFVLFTRENLINRELKKIIKFAEILNINKIEFSTLKLLGNAHQKSLPLKEEIKKAINYIDSITEKSNVKIILPDIDALVHRCDSMTTSISILPNGGVHDCSFENLVSIGNVRNRGLDEIWKLKQEYINFTCNKCKIGGYSSDYRSNL